MKKLNLLLTILFAGSNIYAQTALNFDGINDHLPIKGTSKLNSLGKITLETWIYVTNFSTSPCADCAPIIWNQQNSYRFATGNTKKVIISILNGSSAVSVTSSSTLNANTWNHIAATFNGTKLKIYINGLATDSVTYSSFNISYGSTSSDVWIVDPVTGFGGTLEETRIWDYARSQAEIKEGMIKHYPSNKPGMVLQLSYEDGKAYQDNTAISTVKDGTNYYHDGTLTNFTLIDKDSISNFVLGRQYCDTIAYGKFSVTQCAKYQLPSKKKFVSVSGTYQDTIISYRGCDSVMTITVKILKTSSASVVLANCDSVQNPITKVYYKKSGKYTTTVQNYVGCDSVISYFVTVYNKDTSVLIYDVCNSIQIGSKTFTSTGVYVDTFQGIHGCDSFVYRQIKVRKSTYEKQTLTMCKFVLCPTDGSVVYRKPGTYYDTIPNKALCDSIIEYEVISTASNGILNIKTCGSYMSPSKKYTWTTSGTYFDTLFFGNKVGCDSFMTINLTLTTPAKQSFNVAQCGSYLVPSGTKVVYNSGTVTDFLKAENGCDSIEYTINVTINHANTNFTRSENTLTASTTASGATFQWLNCNNQFAKINGETNKSFTPTADGRFALAVTENTCTDTSGCVNFIYNGIRELNGNEISVYPNPSFGDLNIQSDMDLHSVKVSLINTLGETVKFWDLGDVSIANLHADLHAGCYVIRVESREGILQKFIILE
ncbi:MAG: T9SS type A sorting domain-containing protein [Bacteroidetes bacterium]|nr:T9SS type A sorting domain-containing protein [Bacteroidota bacterium]